MTALKCPCFFVLVVIIICSKFKQPDIVGPLRHFLMWRYLGRSWRTQVESNGPNQVLEQPPYAFVNLEEIAGAKQKFGVWFGLSTMDDIAKTYKDIEKMMVMMLDKALCLWM